MSSHVNGLRVVMVMCFFQNTVATITSISVRPETSRPRGDIRPCLHLLLNVFLFFLSSFAQFAVSASQLDIIDDC